MNPLTKKILVFLLLFIGVGISQNAFAHVLDGIDLSTLSKTGLGWIYLQLGFTHILPFGADHILFIMGLCLLSNNIKTLIWQATAFTVAHSITLSLVIYDIITPNSGIVETIIALSILFIAVENIYTDKLSPWRIVLIFVFGLIHGMGFAGVLTELGMPPTDFVTAIISFNIGVEIGQIAVIFIMYFALIKPFGKKEWYRKRVVNPISIFIGLIAIAWTIERVIELL